MMPMSGKYRITVGLEQKARVKLSFFDGNVTFKDRVFEMNNTNETGFTWIKRTGAQAFEVNDPKCFLVVAKYFDLESQSSIASDVPNQANLIVDITKED